jgi:acyl-CoA thioesterase-1
VQKNLRCAGSRRSSFVRGRAAALARVAAVFLFVFATPSARAFEPGCSAASAIEPGAKLGALDSGADRTLEVLAIGSSSTEGIGASSPANAFPARLQSDLAKEDGIAADVRNAGVGGELAVGTLQRLKGVLKSGWAELVIWQVGTNDAIVGVDEKLFRATVEAGIAATRAAHVPLMLIDPQVTLKAPDEARYERFVKIVDDVGAFDRVPVLSRFAMMRRRGAEEVRALLARDGLHMNDRGYACLAHAIAEAIEKAGVSAFAPLASKGPG